MEVKGVQNGSEKTFKISQYKGRYLVIVFYQADIASADLVQSFATIQPLLTSNGTDLVFCSADSIESHKSWLSSDLGGSFSSPLWSDNNGALASSFDLFDPEKKACVDGVVVIDDSSVIRQVMTSSMNAKDLAKYVVDIVALLKKNKVKTFLGYSSVIVLNDESTHTTPTSPIFQAGFR